MTWYAIACSSKYEDKIADKIGSYAYVPHRTVWRKVRKNQRIAGKSGRIKKFYPLIPGYVLVNLQLGDDIYAVLRRDRHVFGFISGYGGSPLKIKDYEIDYLKSRENMGHYDETKEILRKLIGGRFELHDGALEGKRITISSIKNKDLIIDVEGYTSPVMVSIASFEKIRHTRLG